MAKRYYNTPEWQTLRTKQLFKAPLCAFCHSEGRVYPADTVDHIRPHKGDYGLFFDENNLQSLCRHHHDSEKQQIEKRGYSTRIGADGWPVSNKHPVNVR